MLRPMGAGRCWCNGYYQSTSKAERKLLIFRIHRRWKMEGSSAKKLLDSRVCRVFFSSPFNGMEEERNELTSKYWPQLQSACNRVGVTFVPVDMRWGITSEQSTSSQTINICLQEIDRSDVFVGFFGQRYGWHGLNDSALQATFDAAIPRYPWLEKYRDRSVTELEFLHGHLNNPEKLPTILCFRDKAYDEKMCSVGMKNDDKKQVYKYSAESEMAVERMEDLMKRVKATEDKCLGVNMAYNNPVEGAGWMFEKISEYLKEVLQKPFEEAKLSKHEQELQPHSIFLTKMCALYRDGGNSVKNIDEKFLQGESRLLMIVGELGIGKTALVCNWIKEKISMDPNKIWFYHFVGCSTQSSDPNNIMRRITWSIQQKINSLRTDNIELKNNELEAKSGIELVNECHTWLNKVSEYGLEVVLVVDGLKSIQYESKITRPLFWLPRNIPNGVHIILLTDLADQTHLEELKEFHCEMLELEKLPSAVSIEICKDMLKLRGKTLSEGQLQRVVSGAHVGNPLFLKVVVEELCVFGNFRELDKKIQSLVDCDKISVLFGKTLERLEQDYNSAYNNGNMTEKIMCALCISRSGVTEKEICEIVGIESHQWLPFYYATEPFLNQLPGGFLKLTLEPLAEAIINRYMQTEDRKLTFLKRQITFYERCVKAKSNLDHVYTELLWLCHQSKDKTLVKKYVTDISIFLKLFKFEPYKLLEYVNFLKLSTKELVEELQHAVDIHAIQLYNENTEDLVFDANIGEQLVPVLDSIALFLNVAKYPAEENILLRLKEILENNNRVKDRDVQLHATLYKLACFYVDIREDKKGLLLHESALEFFKNRAPKSNANLEHLGRSYHGTGTVYTRISKFDEAMKCFEKSIEIARTAGPKSDEAQLNITKSLSCIAEVHALQGNYELARQKYEEVVTMQDSIYTLYLPPEMSYPLSNLGISYRRLGLFDKAEEVYNKALKVKSDALGENHVDVGYAYFSLGNLAFDRNQPQVALGYFEHTLDIFKKVNYLESIDAVFVLENIAQVYMGLNDKAKGLPYYWDAFNYLEKHGQMEVGDANVHLNYLRHLLAIEDYVGTQRVSRAMIRCPKMQHFIPYLFLDYVNRSFLSVDPSSEPFEESLDHGIELFPDNISLPFQKMELNLVPNRNLDLINKTLEFYYDHTHDKEERLIVEALKLSHKHGWTDGANSICQYWADKRPDLSETLHRLNDELRKED